ncbi:MAG: 16S rRNA (guanine(966)-N(2))-methyltransferase RsmD [Actinobacteria bacterium]|nr:MAG: 16S rRNA (guanine(966)-N(2))-methyltransferase RsmD [Actinomycetota bacterium]
MVRIISGKAKGRRLAAPDTKGTRPVTDRVREAVFSTIGGWVENADVADLYAGSGSFGLEALSRGASSAVFVENAAKAVAALKENVEALGLGGEVVRAEVRKYLESADREFHLVFIDPPWPMPTEDLEADFVALDRLLVDRAEVIASRRHSDRRPVPPENWRVATEKRYGDTRILRYEKEVAET